jgi:carotenoid cleavage dioxygenase
VEPTWTHASRFLQGNYGPIMRESERVPVKVVGGDIPDCLVGATYVRNGPNPHFQPVARHHWFDGDGRVNAVHFDKNGAFFSSKWVRTKDFLFEDKLGKSWFYGIADFGSLVTMGVEVVRSFLFGTPALGKVSANTAVVFHAHKLLALVENGAPHQIASQTLDTVGKFDYDGQLKHAFTAHPKVDPITGEMFAFGYNIGNPKHPAVSYFWVSPDGKKAPSIAITLKDNRQVMMHDFAITRDYAVFLDYPYVFALANLLSGKPPLAFMPEAGARIGVLPRKDADEKNIKWFTIEASFAFHTANAWQDGDKVVVIASRYKHLELETLAATKEQETKLSTGTQHMYVLDMKTGEVEEKTVVPLQGDFPVVDEANRLGFKTRFFWFCVSSKSADGGFGRICKVDLKDNSTTFFDLGDGEAADEFVFTNGNPERAQYKGDYDDARNNTAPDDNGFLTGFVYSRARNTSHLLILNAATMKEYARIELPHRVPHGFHGKALTRAQLQSEVVPSK